VFLERFDARVKLVALVVRTRTNARALSDQFPDRQLMKLHYFSSCSHALRWMFDECDSTALLLVFQSITHVTCLLFVIGWLIRRFLPSYHPKTA
jgi:hypothetical protein